MNLRATRVGARKLSLVERLRRIQRSAFGAGGLGPIEVARRWPPYARSALLTLVIALITALVVAQNFLPNRLNLRPGDVATQDVQAPRTVRYESVSKTQEARDTAAKQVPDQFDGSITSQQRQALDSLNGRYLVGADVIIQGAKATLITDSLGRFRIDSLAPGTYQVGVFHPLLESLAPAPWHPRPPPWHPQGPHTAQPPPVPLHFGWPPTRRRCGGRRSGAGGTA